MIATGGAFRPEQRRLLAEAVEIGERRLSDVLVPRRDVVALPADASVETGSACWWRRPMGARRCTAATWTMWSAW
jgi:hypothetical protein